MTPKICTIVGARPQFIKCAPVSRALRQVASEVIIHTGQHYDHDMSAVFFSQLRIPEPDHSLGIGSASHGAQTGQMLQAIERVLTEEKPDCVLVYGDTNSTLAGALAAAKMHVPLAHVEAGLRSFNKKMPEEVNRVLTDHVSDLLFCPTETAVKNLSREGITTGVHLVGDVMYDSLLENASLADGAAVLGRMGLKSKDYALATVHRVENTDDRDRLRSIFRALDEIAELCLPVILPLHPRTREKLGVSGPPLSNLRITDPVPYLDLLVLEKNARLVLTDSGGMQKEACLLRVPCVTLRDETEWIETVEAGWNVLVGADSQRIVDAARSAAPGKDFSAYGDGHATERIVDLICRLLGEEASSAAEC